MISLQSQVTSDVSVQGKPSTNNKTPSSAQRLSLSDLRSRFGSGNTSSSSSSESGITASRASLARLVVVGRVIPSPPSSRMRGVHGSFCLKIGVDFHHLYRLFHLRGRDSWSWWLGRGMVSPRRGWLNPLSGKLFLIFAMRETSEIFREGSVTAYPLCGRAICRQETNRSHKRERGIKDPKGAVAQLQLQF